jgi:hypothetical protein
MQTQRPNQKDDQRKQGSKDLSGQSKNVNSKNESNLKNDKQTDSNADRNTTAKNQPKSPSTSKDR